MLKRNLEYRDRKEYFNQDGQETMKEMLFILQHFKKCNYKKYESKKHANSHQLS